MRRFLSSSAGWAAGVVLFLALVIGCGGSGGSGGTVAAPTGKQAVRSASLAGYQSLGAGSALPYVAAQVAAPKGSLLALAAKALLPVRGISYVQALGLYSSSATYNGTQATILYYTDAAGTHPAGSMTVTAPSGFAYSSYPATVTVAASITAGNLPCNGKLQIVYTDSSGANTMTGNLQLTKNNESMSLNLKLTDSLVLNGGMTISENGTTITATNMSGPVAGDATFQFTLGPQEYTGTGTVDLTTADISLTFTNPAGSSASVNSSGDLVITYSDGKVETIDNPLSATLLGGDGGTTGGTSTSGGTGTTSGGTGTTSGSTPPYTLASVSGTSPTIQWVAPGGEMVGMSGGIPSYWSSPTAQPAAIKTDPTVSGLIVTGVNSSGNIVGLGQSGTNAALLFWKSYNTAPVHMFVPAGVVPSDSGNAWIQTSGRIIASFLGSNLSSLPTYVYSSSTDANPVLLPGGSVNGVSDGNEAIGYNASSVLVYWSQLTGSVQPTPIPVANTPSVKSAKIGGNGNIAVSDLGANTLTVLTAPSYSTQTVLKAPTGTLTGTGLGPTGHVFGSLQVDTTGRDNDGLIWTSLTGSPINLRSTATPGVTEAFYETTSGVLVVGSYDTSGTFHYGAMTPKP